jgi:hypothetical protein
MYWVFWIIAVAHICPGLILLCIMCCTTTCELEIIITLVTPENFHLDISPRMVTVACNTVYSTASIISSFRQSRDFSPIYSLRLHKTTPAPILSCSSRDSSIQIHRVEGSSIVTALDLAMFLDSITRGIGTRIRSIYVGVYVYLITS